MGEIDVQEYTSKNPITMAGYEAGLCYGSDVSSPEKNYKRGLRCFKDGHGRTMEFAQVYLTIDEYSARVIREFYTSIGGMPTRLQESTRYINYYEGFDYITPPAILRNKKAKEIYDNEMARIAKATEELMELGISKEDSANLLPLGMETKITYRTNLRNLVDMSRQRDCTRAYWEYRKLMRNIEKVLSSYSDEWKTCVDLFFGAKCEYLRYCPEHKSCGLYPTLEEK